MSQFTTPTNFIADLPVSTNLVDTELKQSHIAFPGGYMLSFVDVLSGVIDIDVRNYSIFYLTKKLDLSQTRVNSSSTRSIKYISTTLKNGDTYLRNDVISPLPADGSVNPNVLNLVYGVNTTTDVEEAGTYRIDFIDDVFCTVSYTDVYGVSYLTIGSNNNCVLKRGYNYDSKEIEKSLYFRYTLGRGNISLIKNTCDGPALIHISGNKLVAKLVDQLTDSMLFVNSFKMIGSIEETTLDTDDMNFIKYRPNSVVIDAVNSYRNLNNNYLITKNLNTRDAHTIDIITLKNQMSDLNTMVRGNNMVLSSGNTKIEKLETDMRSYTSINKTIDGFDQHDLDLNYTSYNAAYKILPGRNIIKTKETLYPYSQINIQDTKFINCGAFSALTPAYADRVLLQEKNNKGEDYVYLCTWLSGAPLSNKKIWVDRYYYPDLITKQGAIEGNITFTSYDKYVQDFILNDSNAFANVQTDYFFDVRSNMVFEPNSEYVYDRIDLNKMPFVDSDNILNTSEEPYYPNINKNGGFVFATKIRSFGRTKSKTIKSLFNKIPAGVVISYNGRDIIVSCTLYDNQTGRLIKEEGQLGVDNIVTSNVVISVDNVRGLISAFINGIRVIDSSFPPLKYSTILYGDFVTDEGQSLFSSEKYLIDPFISDYPLTPNFVELLNCKYNSVQEEMTITLPQGQRNNIDSIKELNSLQVNKKSKASDIDIYINDIETDDTALKGQVAAALRGSLHEVTPIDTNIRNIEVL